MEYVSGNIFIRETDPMPKGDIVQEYDGWVKAFN